MKHLAIVRRSVLLTSVLSADGCGAAAHLSVADGTGPRPTLPKPKQSMLPTVNVGFVKENGDAMGRPVGVAIDKGGALLVADDVGNTIWRVTATSGVTK